MAQLNIQVIHAREFVRTTPVGEFDINAARDMLFAAAHTALSSGNTDILLDCRQTTSKISMAEITSLVYTMLSHRDLFARKLAFLCSDSARFDNMQFMEDFAVNRGLQVGAFTDYEEALSWLMPSTSIAQRKNN